MLSMVEVVDEYVGLLHDEREPDGLLHPSSIWDCARRAVYTLRGVLPTDPHSARTRRRFRLGTMVHQLVASALATAPEVLQFFAEFEVRGERDAGHGDVLLELEDGRWVVVEIKSVRAAKPAVDARHLGQARHYAVRARTSGVWVDEGTTFIGPLGDRLAGVVLVYVGRESADVTDHFFAYDVGWEKAVEKRITELDAYRVRPDALPPRIDNARSTKSRACFGCPYATRCWTHDGAGIALVTTSGQAESSALSARAPHVPSEGRNSRQPRRSPDPEAPLRREVQVTNVEEAGPS